MDITDALAQWLLGRLELMPLEVLRESAGRRAVERLLIRILGEREAAEVRALLSYRPGVTPRSHAILLPGVMGSILASVRGISAMLWPNPTVVLNGHINLLDLNAQGTGDQSPDVEIMPIGIEKLTYLKTILTLASETRLYEFPYDWRRHLEWNATLLHEAIERWSTLHLERRFTLVGHSMGGILARTYLARYPREAEERVERVIMLGTPLRGVAISVLTFYGDTPPAKIVSRLHPGNDVIHFTANLPSSYQLLPPPPDQFRSDRPYPVNWDLYNADAWGLPHTRQDYLDDARRLHKLISDSDPQVEQVEIAGCYRRTLTDVWRALDDDKPAARPNCTLVHQEGGEDSGDETVPLWSTRMEGITTYYVEEAHLHLPSNRHVLGALLELIHGGAPALPRELPEPLGLMGRLRSVPLMQQVAKVRRRIENGEFSRQDLERLFFAR